MAARELMQQMGLTAEDLARRKLLVGLTDADSSRIARLDEIVRHRIDDLTSTFFTLLSGHREASPLLDDHRVAEQARMLKREHLVALASGGYGVDYVEQRVRLALLYSEVGLEPRLFLGAFHRLIESIGASAMKGSDRPYETFEDFLALTKVAALDTAIIADVLVFTRERELGASRQALREKALVFTRVLESISDGVVVVDGEGKFVLVNTAIERLLRVATTSAPPQAWSSVYGLFRADGVTPFPEDELPLVRAIRGEQTPVVSMFLRNRDVPEGVHLDVVGSPLSDGRGATVGGVAVFRDITASKRAEEMLRKTEEQLRQSQKMEAIGRLAGGVAHDFNNLLSVIISYSEMLLADLTPSDPMREEVEEIHRAGRRAADLTRQLLLFSRQQVLESSVIDLNDTLASVDKMLQRVLGADVSLVSRRGPELGRVRADPAAIEQVILNLVVNARDAMPTGGQLTIETGNVDVDEDFAREHAGAEPGPHVMLAVTDTGIGMDQATMGRIFEPFFTTKEKGKGTGLGLSTVFGIVQQNGGLIFVYSEPNKGTCFKIYLPRVDDVIEPRVPMPAAKTLRGTETILLVDDDDQVRNVARSILIRNGYHVIDARNAGEALLCSERHGGAIHLLLTDVVMPHVSGVELARRLAETRPDMRLLCMSGYTDDTVVRHGIVAARVAYLQKPMTPESLTRKVREVLDRSPERGGVLAPHE